MKLIRNLIFPWLVFFFVTAGGLVAIGVKFTRVHATPQQLLYALGVGSFLCLLLNMNSLGNVGIWMSESLPESLRYSSWRWIVRAMKALVIAAAFWFVGQLPWVPLFWQGGVIPGVFTIALFVFIFSLWGPILKFSSNMAWSRAFSVILSLPILAAVPVTAMFIGQSMVSSYRSSRPDLPVPEPEPVAVAAPLTKRELKELKNGKGPSAAALAAAKPVAPKAPAEPPAPKLAPRAQAMEEIAMGTGSCAEHDKEITAALEPRGPEDLVYWGIQAVKCSDIKSVVGLTKLSQIMMEHPVPRVRAAAIDAMKKFGHDNVKLISYLLVKRLNEKEPPEVIEAAARALAPLGEDESKWAVKRLKGLLDSANGSFAAAKTLIEVFHRNDDVSTYIAQNMGGSEDARRRAVAMICLLPSSERVVADEHLDSLVGTIRSTDQKDPGVKALSCLGNVGFAAIQAELNHPKRLTRVQAAQVFAELEVKNSPEAIETADTCARDSNEVVRQWCSRSLGRMGAPALPKILDLLKSGDPSLKQAGQDALQVFDDSHAKGELLRIRAENSGWMATNKKLQIARAVGGALTKMETASAPEILPPAPITSTKQ